MTDLDLNANQRAIVDGDDSPLLVVAGPGSGKTTVLQKRIERLLDKSPGSFSRILGITFTTVAAANLRSRLEHLPEDRQGRLEIGTFHAFAAKILQQHGSHLGLSTNFTIISSTEDRAAIAAEVLGELGETTDPRRLLPLLGRLYERGIAEGQIPSAISGEVPSFIGELFSRYRTRSIERDELDFPLLVYLCNWLFRELPNIPRQLRKVYRSICVDEFQDTNESQFEMLRLIAGDDPTGLLFLADQDQIIYQWNGASPRRLHEAQERFNMSVMLLPTSFRCPSTILSAANRLIANNLNRFVAPNFVTTSSDTGVLLTRDFSDDAAEASWIAQEISAAGPAEFGKTIVLARSRRILEPILAACEARKVKVVMPVQRYEFESAPVSMLHNILRLASVPTNEAALERTTAAYFEMTGESLDPTAIKAQAEASLITPLEVFFGSAAMACDSPHFNKLEHLVRSELIGHGNFRPIGDAFFSWVEQLAKSGARTAYAAAYEDERTLWRDFEQTHRGLESERKTLAEFLRALNLESKTPEYKDTTKLITVHGAKGLEFSRVYVAGVAEGQFPAFQAVQLGPKSEPMEEERRSFFVAMTRCQHELTITFARRYRGFAARPSRFLSEMAPGDD
jgi:DNA helicase-2/ATP-dependent DNA helicase PcrA